MLGNFACFLSSVDLFFKLIIFQKKNVLGIPSVSNSLEPDQVLSGLIWVQTVCKGYQQMIKVATSGERVKNQMLDIQNGGAHAHSNTK